MGSYGLPALAVKTPEPGPSPLQQFAQIQSIRGLMQQNQMGGVQLQQAQQAQQDQQTVRKAFMDSNGDLDQAIKLSAQRGVSPGMLTQLQQHAVDVKTKLSTLQSDQLKNMATQNDNARGLIQPIVNAKPEDQPALYAAARQTALQNPQAYGITDPNQIPEQFPGADALKTQVALHMGGSKQAEEAIKERETKAKEMDAQARATSADTASKRLIAEMPGGAMQPVEQKELSEFMANPPKGYENMATPTGFAKWKASLAPVANFNLQNGGFNPNSQAYQDNVNGVAAGKLKIENVITPRTPLSMRQQFLSDVMNANPEFKASDFDIEKGVLKKFTSGNASDALTAINTAREHMNTFKQTADALGNGNFLYANKVGNWLGTQFGQDKATNFNVARTAFAGEVGKAFAGANVGVQDRQELIDKINEASSFAQLKGYADTADNLLAGKQKALKESFDQGAKGKPNFGQQNNAQQNTGAYTPPAGAKSAIGPNGHKINVDGGKWVDSETGKPI